MQGALRARLLAAGAVAALAARRVTWVDRPQESALPAITLQVVSDPRPQHLQGFNSLRPTRVQLDAWGDSYADVRALTEAAIAAVVPEGVFNGVTFNRAMVDGSRDLGERTETKFIYRISTDLIIWWS